MIGRMKNTKRKVWFGAIVLFVMTLMVQPSSAQHGEFEGEFGTLDEYTEITIHFCGLGASMGSNGFPDTSVKAEFMVCIYNPTDLNYTFEFETSHYYNITAVRESDGKEVWRYPPKNNPPKGGPMTIEIADGGWYDSNEWVVWENVPRGKYIINIELVGYDINSDGIVYNNDQVCNLFRCSSEVTSSSAITGEGAAIIAVTGGSFIGGGAFVLTETGKYLSMGLLAPLYTRLKKNKVLDNFTRGQIQGFIQANPGAHVRVIRDNFRLSNGVVTYHLRVLEREGYISSMSDGFKRRFYPGSNAQLDQPQELSVIQNLLISLIEKTPGCSQSDLAKMAKTSPQVVNYHLKKLFELELISMDKEGRIVKCYVKKENVQKFLQAQKDEQESPSLS